MGCDLGSWVDLFYFWSQVQYDEIKNILTGSTVLKESELDNSSKFLMR